jgi:hypothetical protein
MKVEIRPEVIEKQVEQIATPVTPEEKPEILINTDAIILRELGKSNIILYQDFIVKILENYGNKADNNYIETYLQKRIGKLIRSKKIVCDKKGDYESYIYLPKTIETKVVEHIPSVETVPTPAPETNIVKPSNEIVETPEPALKFDNTVSKHDNDLVAVTIKEDKKRNNFSTKPKEPLLKTWLNNWVASVEPTPTPEPENKIKKVKQKDVAATITINKRSAEMERKQGLLLNFINENPSCTAKQYREKMIEIGESISVGTIYRYINQLCAKGKLKKLGYCRNRYYEVIETTEVILPSPEKAA